MNLEEELNTLESTSNIMNMNQMPTEMNQMQTEMNMNNFNTIPMNNQAMPNMMPPVSEPSTMAAPTYQVNQPAMVNPNAAQDQASAFNYASLEFDINKPLYERNPLERLTGDKGVTFRVHMLPGVSPSQVHVHWDAEKGHNIVCLRDVYNTPGEPCCGTHEQAKVRVVIPVVLYPTVQGNPNMLIPGAKAELKTLVLGYKSFQDLQTQAGLTGVPLTQGDIFATVDNPQYKSFNFVVRQDSLISQVSNVQELTALWREVGTPKNICAACGKVITREEYQAAYASYDANAYKAQNTPTNGQAATTFAFNQGMAPGFGQPYQNNFNQNQPFYGTNQGQNGFNQGGFNQNPWA